MQELLFIPLGLCNQFCLLNLIVTTIIPLETGGQLASSLHDNLGFPLVQPIIRRFPDGETFLRIPTIDDDAVLLIQSLYQPQETHLFNLLNLAFNLKKKGVSKIQAITPYLCYARADREVLGGEAVSIQTVFQLAKASGIDEIIATDLHNPEVIHLSPPTLKITNILPTRSMATFVRSQAEIDQNWIVLAPDRGAKFRAKALSRELGIKYNYFLKHRNPKTGEVSLIGDAGLSDLEENVIIIDDIMATGRSLVQVINHLKFEGVQKIVVMVSHAFGTDSVDQMIEMGNVTVAATTSVPSPISRIDIAEDIIHYLRTKEN